MSPPKHEDEISIYVSPVRCANRESSPSSSPVASVKHTVTDFTLNDNDNDNNQDAADLTAHLDASALRATRLASYLDELNHNSSSGPPSLLNAACRASLQLQFPTVLEQTALWIDSCWSPSATASDRIVANIRASLGLARMDQYLAEMERTLDLSSSSDHHVVEERLGCIVQSLRAQQGAAADALETTNCCTVSALHGDSSIYFDLAVGPRVQTSVSSSGSSTSSTSNSPLQVSVQPMVELAAHDLIQGRILADAVTAYTVEMISCKHNADGAHAGYGWTGVATVRLRLQSSSRRGGGVGDYYGIHEARVFQPNAYPPRPQSNVDIYTSSTEGDHSGGIDVILIAHTFQTKSGETPRLQIELVMPISKQQQTVSPL